MENNIWNELSEESKKYVKGVFSEFEPVCKEDLVRMNLMDDLFGKENLTPKQQIKTWEDYEKLLGSDMAEINNTIKAVSLLPCPKPIVNKMIAIYKISVLVDLGYGGIITDEEWADNTKEKFAIVYYNNKFDNVNILSGIKEFIAFHTEMQRDAFLKHNEKLCKDYYMI